MKRTVVFLLVGLGVFFCVSEAAAQAIDKAQAGELLRKHFAAFPDWWQHEGCFVMLTAKGEVNQKLLQRLNLDLLEYLYKNYKHLRELEAAGLVTIETGERTDGRVKKSTYQVNLTEKMRRDDAVIDRESGWTIATYRTRKLVAVERITGIVGMAPDRGATVFYTRQLRVSPFGEAIGMRDKTESAIIQLLSPDGNSWRVNDTLSKLY